MYGLQCAYGFTLVSLIRITLRARVLIQAISTDNAVIGNPSICNTARLSV